MSRVTDLRRSEAAKDAEAAPIARHRDETVFRKRLDVLWSLNRAVQDKQALDLTQVGFEKVGDGIYAPKKSEESKWWTLQGTLARWKDPASFEADAPELLNRGFREQDVEALRNYLKSTNTEVASLQEQRTLAAQMQQTIQTRRNKGQQVSHDELDAFNYQMRLNGENAERRWAVGMFDVLDAERQRILSSVVEEFQEKGSHTVFISETKNPPDVDRKQLDSLASGQYVNWLDSKLQQR